MKKAISFILMLSILMCSFPLNACATEADTPTVSAVICDEAGNIIETLEVTVSTSNPIDNARSSSVYREVTYTARATTTTSGASAPKDGVTATLTIAWNDFFGTNNQLVSVSGSWAVGDETISGRYITYSAFNMSGNTLQSLHKWPTGNSFVYEPSNFTGYRFALVSQALIDSTGNYLIFSVST